MKVVYVAGRYRDESAWAIEQNIRKAEVEALSIWRMGAVALCPHPMTRYYQGAAPDEIWLGGMLELMRRCDAVYMVDGWKQSKGSIAEADEAVRLGIPVFVTMAKLERWIKSDENESQNQPCANGVTA